MNFKINPRIALAGSVNSSERVLAKLLEHEMNVHWVLGLDPKYRSVVSGFKDLKASIDTKRIDFSYFDRLNEDWIIDGLKKRDIDIFFVIGLSQIVRLELLDTPNICCIGYHPTRLPKGRGRGAIAWTILGKTEPAATFFKLNEEADSGEIIVQKDIDFKGNEYPQRLIDKLMEAIDNAMDEVLPLMKKGLLPVIVQDNKEASYLGKRAPSDGLINWQNTALDIERHIRSVSHPLPGAISFLGNREITIWKSREWSIQQIIGVPGRIVKIMNNSFVVCTGQGLLEIVEWEGVDISELVEGKMLGINWVVLYRKIMINEQYISSGSTL
jgi:methionyl-tRNA formyltransferase